MERIYHTWDKWECYPAGFYEARDESGRPADEVSRAYAAFLADDEAFRAALARVLAEWPKSCEHYLSNENMNRIAWLGQASACITLGIPNTFRSGFRLLSAAQQARANATALEALNRWLAARGEPAIESVDAAASRTQVELY